MFKHDLISLPNRLLYEMGRGEELRYPGSSLAVQSAGWASAKRDLQGWNRSWPIQTERELVPFDQDICRAYPGHRFEYWFVRVPARAEVDWHDHHLAAIGGALILAGQGLFHRRDRESPAFLCPGTLLTFDGKLQHRVAHVHAELQILSFNGYPLTES